MKLDAPLQRCKDWQGIRQGLARPGRGGDAEVVRGTGSASGQLPHGGLHGKKLRVALCTPRPHDQSQSFNATMKYLPQAQLQPAPCRQQRCSQPWVASNYSAGAQRRNSSLTPEQPRDCCSHMLRHDLLHVPDGGTSRRHSRILNRHPPVSRPRRSCALSPRTCARGTAVPASKRTG